MTNLLLLGSQAVPKFGSKVKRSFALVKDYISSFTLQQNLSKGFVLDKSFKAATFGLLLRFAGLVSLFNNLSHSLFRSFVVKLGGASSW